MKELNQKLNNTYPSSATAQTRPKHYKNDRVWPALFALFLATFYPTAQSAAGQVIKAHYANPYSNPDDRNNYDIFQRMTYEQRIYLLLEGSLKAFEREVQGLGVSKCNFSVPPEELKKTPKLIYETENGPCYFSMLDNSGWLVWLIKVHDELIADLDHKRESLRVLELERQRLTAIVKKQPRKRLRGRRTPPPTEERKALDQVQKMIKSLDSEIDTLEKQIIEVDGNRWLIDEDGGRFFVQIEKARRILREVNTNWKLPVSN